MQLPDVAAERVPEALKLIRSGISAALAMTAALVFCFWALFVAMNWTTPLALVSLLVVTLAALAGGWFLRQTMLDLAAREDRAALLAGHDLLSGLANRRLFCEWLDYELARQRRESAKFALMYLDVDRFKEINDRFGHEAGDRMIAAVARRIGAILRPTDRFGRLGGDEFAILQIGVRDMRDAQALAVRIVEAMRQPFDLGRIELAATTSIGIALCPDNATARDELMHNADLALYRAKREGRDRFAFFDARMSDDVAREAIVEHDLVDALDHDALSVDYLTIIDAQTRVRVGVEARLRWLHPERGLIEPSEFLAVAERRNVMLRLGEWLLRRICKDAAAWPDLRVAVETPPALFRHRDFATMVRKIVLEAGVDPSRFELQISEAGLLDRAEAAASTMKLLRADGFRFAVAGFGAGVVSLDHLRRFPFGKVKFDRTCLDDGQPGSDKAILLHSNVHLARSLGLRVLADGVETEDQARFLVALGCQELQGPIVRRIVEADRARIETEELG